MKHLVKIIVVVSAASLLVVGPASAHVRTANTHISLSASKTNVHKGTRITWTIHLKSPWSKCYANQPVKWYKNGNFKRVRTTNGNGVIQFTKKMWRTSTYQARYAGRQWGVHPHQHTCKPSNSNRVTIHVRHH